MNAIFVLQRNRDENHKTGTAERDEYARMEMSEMEAGQGAHQPLIWVRLLSIHE